MKILSLILTSLLLASCNVYELIGQETDTIVSKYPRIEITPNSLRVADLPASSSRSFRARVFNESFLTGINNGDINLSSSGPGSFTISNVTYLNSKEINIQISVGAVPAAYDQIYFDFVDTGFTTSTPYTQSNYYKTVQIEP